MVTIAAETNIDTLLTTTTPTVASPRFTGEFDPACSSPIASSDPFDDFEDDDFDDEFDDDFEEEWDDDLGGDGFGPEFQEDEEEADDDADKFSDDADFDK